VIAVLATAPKHQSGKFVFQRFFDGTGVDGVGWSHRASSAYVAVIGSIMAQYGLTGKSEHSEATSAVVSPALECVTGQLF